MGKKTKIKTKRQIEKQQNNNKTDQIKIQKTERKKNFESNLNFMQM